MSAPSWELSKENVAPLVRGRDHDALKVALHATRDEVAAMHAAHEEAVKAAAAGAGPHADDPLAPAAAFIKWAAEAYAPRATPLLRALEGTCRAFVDDTRYANDPRLVRLWVRYADAREDPLDCFAFMKAHGIGEQSALFYEAWATTLEYKRDFPAADAAYRRGVDLDAQPKKRLVQRQHEFLARMAARDRRAEAKAGRAKRKGAKDTSSRNASSHREQKPASTFHASTDENERPALGALTTRQASSGRRPLVAPEKKQNPASSSGRTATPALVSKSAKTLGNVDTSFEVFVDPDASAAASSVSADNVLPPLPTLTDLDQVRKENEGELPSQWAGVVLPQNEQMTKARIRAGARQRQGMSGAPFRILSETEDDLSEDGDDNAQTTRGKDTGERNQAAAAATKRGKWTAAGPASPTINTKIAMQEVEDMFNSPLPFEREGQVTDDTIRQGSMSGMETDLQCVSQEKCKERPSAPAFEIYRDSAEVEEPVNHLVDDFDKENASVQESANLLTRKDCDSGDAILRPIPGLEGTINPSDPSTYVEVEYVPLDAPPVHDFAFESIETTRLGTAQEVNAKLEDWCIDSCPQLPGYEMLDGNCTELSNGNLVSFETGVGEPRSFFIESKLGDGKERKSVVYEASPVDTADDEGDEQNYAIKASDNVNLLWEFYIYNVVSIRMPAECDDRTRASIPKALAFYHGEPLSYLITDQISHANLAQIVELAVGAQSCTITSDVVLFFLIELLRSVEVVHSVGIIHADVSLENVIIRKDGTRRLIGSYNTAGQGGWASVGVALIDLNHAVDTRHSALGGQSAKHILAHTAFLGNSHMSADCGSASEAPWGFNADCQAIAACGRKLVATCTPTSALPVFTDIFSKLQRIPADALGDETVDIMRECRFALEEKLIEGCTADDGSTLRARLASIFSSAREASAIGDVTQG